MSAQDYKQYNYSGYYYSGGSFASQACGPCSVADVVEVSPLTVAQWLTNNGYATQGHGTEWEGIAPALTAFNAGGTCLGVDMIRYPIPNAVSAFKGAIIDGRMGVLCMGVGTSNYWTNSGHYIAVVGYRDGKYLVHDPASTTRTGWHPWSDFEGNVKCAYTSTKRWGISPVATYSFKVKEIRLGDSGNDVFLLQRLLKSRGMYKGLDKQYGAKTEAAVKKYQKWISDHGGSLKVDGVCGPATWTSILGISGDVKTVKEVKQGDKGIDVYIVQELLSATGYYQGALDMSFGPATAQAVKDYQRKKRIAVDGVVGPTTWRVLVKL